MNIFISTGIRPLTLDAVKLQNHFQNIDLEQIKKYNFNKINFEVRDVFPIDELSERDKRKLNMMGIDIKKVRPYNITMKFNDYDIYGNKRRKRSLGRNMKNKESELELPGKGKIFQIMLKTMNHVFLDRFSPQS